MRQEQFTRNAKRDALAIVQAPDGAAEDKRMWNDAVWLTLPEDEISEKGIYHGDMTGRFAYFRCELELPAAVRLTAGLTANSRYRLWVNGSSVLSGPCKGDIHRQYYETVELTSWLVPGKNVFCVQVLYCDPDAAETQTDERASIYGVISPRAGHRFAMEGDVLDASGTVIASVTTGKADWRVWLDSSFYLKSNEITQFLGAVIEEIDFSKSPAGWKAKDYDASRWKKAKSAVPVLPGGALYLCGVQPKFRVRQREIPLLYEEEDFFSRDFYRADGKPAGLLQSGKMTVPPGRTAELILDAGVIKNGYPRYVFQSGKGAEVSFTYFEKFGGPGSDLPRTDYINGAVSGLTDSIRLSGEETVYEPFWVRTFRFVRITIRAAQEPVILLSPTFHRTGYPLQVESAVRSTVPWVEQLWDICVRTLGNCMLETYMDCPYYEQLQFAMDTRLEALFTYVVTNDHALARKALIDFHYGMLPEGLTPGKYPSAYLQILSTFSLHYIFMLWEYFRQTGDIETVRLCRGDVDRILDYYDGKIGSDGLVGRLDYWEFVDWHPDWGNSSGAPAALQAGPSTIINLMYAYALSCGGGIFAATGRTALAAEYDNRRKSVLDAVQRLCWDEAKGLYREGPAFPQYTRHAQAWAVLNGMSDTPRQLLTRAAADENCLTCSFSTSYEWFRALETAGMYEELRHCLNEWIHLLELGCTTCPETPRQARSDCHAWSALPMYELIRTLAGIHWEGPGRVRIIPHLMDLPDLEGTAITPDGPVQFRYQVQENGKYHCRLHLPDGVSGRLIFPSGEQHMLVGGGHEFSE